MPDDHVSFALLGIAFAAVAAVMIWVVIVRF
jgi:hypothetical protein